MSDFFIVYLFMKNTLLWLVVLLLSAAFGRYFINSSNSTTAQETTPEFLQWMYDEWLTIYNTLEDFRGGDTITRGEAAKFFAQFARLQILDRTFTECDFTDIEWYDSTLTPHIKQACLFGLMKGSNGTYRPEGKITEAEAITVVMRSIYGFFAETLDPRYIAYYNRGSELWLIKDETLTSVGTTNITREKLWRRLYETAQLNEDGWFYSEKPGQAHYVQYSEDAFDQAIANGNQVALFFHAIRCPICHGTRDVITDNITDLPNDVRIFEVDIDKRWDLKEKYDVLAQTTFVFFDNEWNNIETSRSIYPDIIEGLNERFK